MGPRPKAVNKKTEIDYEIRFRSKEAEDIKIDYSNEAVNRTLIRIVESRGRSGNQSDNIYLCEKMIQHFIQSDLKRALEILLITMQLQIDQAKVEGTFYISRKAWQ